jgi:hypothetical protein
MSVAPLSTDQTSKVVNSSTVYPKDVNFAKNGLSGIKNTATTILKQNKLLISMTGTVSALVVVSIAVSSSGFNPNLYFRSRFK